MNDVFLNRKFIQLTAGALLAVVVLSGCTIRFGGRQPSTAGVYKSFDGSENWVGKSLYLHSGGTGTIETVAVIDFVIDPQDPDAIYLTTENHGLLYSYDAGESWRHASGIDSGRVDAVAIDPRNKCIIYSSFANTIRKSVDCNRSFREVYIDTRAEQFITAVAVDRFNNLLVYAGNTGGDILKSFDGGNNWQVITRTENQVTKILIDPEDTRIIYVATKGKGIQKTIDAGQTWTDLSEGLRQYSAALEYKELVFDPNQPNTLLYVSKYGLLKTDDGGATWLPITLITPPTSTDIYSVAINPINADEMYYATASTFYKTADGGGNWITRRLPSNALPTALYIDPRNPAVLFMGLTPISQR